MPIFNEYPEIGGVSESDLLLAWDAETGKVKTSKSAPIKNVATMAALKAFVVTTIPTGFQIQLRSFSTSGDGGGGAFQYDASSVVADNGGTVIAPAAGSGRWIRIFTGALNVRWFGAKGDGVANDYASIQAANLASGDGDLAVYLPSGNYKIGTGIILRGLFNWSGDGQDSTTIVYNGLGTALQICDGNGVVTQGFSLSNMTISGFVGNTPTGVYGISLGAAAGSNVAAQGNCYNVSVYGFTTAAWRFIAGQGVDLIACVGNFSGSGFLCDYVAGGANRALAFFRCVAKHNLSKGLHIKEGGGLEFYGSQFEENTQEGIHIEAVVGSTFGAIEFNQCHVEGNQITPGGGAPAYVGQLRVSNSSGGVIGQYPFVNITGGRWVPNDIEANGGKLNRLWVLQCVEAKIDNVRPTAFVYPHGAFINDANNSTGLYQTANYAPFLGSPTTQFPINTALLFTNPGSAGIVHSFYLNGAFYRSAPSGAMYRIFASGNQANSALGQLFLFDSTGVVNSAWDMSALGLGTTTPNSKAILELVSTTKGFLPTRMTTGERDAIASPPAGLEIYNTTTNKKNFYNGAAWEVVTSA